MTMKKKIASLLLVGCLLMVALAGCSSKNVGADNRDGVVRVVAMGTLELHSITRYDANGNPAQYSDQIAGVIEAPLGTGSAFGVGKAGKETKYYVTNRHVVADDSGLVKVNGEIYYSFSHVTGVYILLDDHGITGMTLDTSRAVPCELLYKADSDEADLAVLEAAEPIKGRKALPLLKKSDLIDSGDEVWALGYPGATEDLTSDSYGNQTYYGSVERVTVTNGTVSLHSSMTVDDARINVIQHTATINHGNSGGPLLDKHGAVAAVNTWGWGSDDINYFASIEIDYVWDILDELDIKADPYQSNTWLLILLIVLGALVLLGGGTALILVLKRKPVRETAGKSAGSMIGVPVRLQFTSGVYAGRRFAVEEGSPVRLGIAPGAGGLQFPDRTPGVSHSHAIVILSGGNLTIQDLGSTYGTYVNGQRLAPNTLTALHMGDRVWLGSEQQSFTVTGKGGV